MGHPIPVGSPLNRAGRAGLLGLAGLGLLGWRAVRRLEVHGNSMCPTLSPGDRLIAVRGLRVRPGDVVAVRDPRQPARIIVKRAAARTPAGWQIVGDNPEESTDSRTFGPVGPEQLLGRIVYRYHPEARAGWLRRPAAGNQVPSASPWRSPTSTSC